NPIIASYSDVSPLMEGICFEAAFRLSGETFVLTGQTELDALYDRIDKLDVCAHRMTRRAFDFSGSRILAGTWTYAPQGCKAHHEIVQLLRDDAAKTLTLQYRLAVEGDCPYELLRPLWTAVE